MFDKILIANRGEIAVRVIRTCKSLGIETVAVFSDADRRNLHVQLADEAVWIGGAHAQDSYLYIRKVIDAALSSDCQAIHPGYGFLSENHEFAKAVELADLTFIGPSAETISIMGDKITSKNMAIKAGVPVISGHTNNLVDAAEAINIAATIGYPVLLKPAAGGGGKGMRIVHKPEEMDDALASCRQETKKAFGDDRIFLERYIPSPRHVEIQIIADNHGHVVHLGERECSIQRRYQKIIEESPSLGVGDELRAQMGTAACELARRVGYTNAGTIEYVMDADGRFYFLEMNTRLQVEHPVTEMVTGLDLVELQLRVAAGEPLPITQDDVSIKGWSIEARICAEDPEKGFIPATGMVTRYAEPKGKQVRVDSGVHTGSKVDVYYDSLLAKVICFGKDREEARLMLVDALNGYHIEGMRTNLDFVNAILTHQAFIEGKLSTGFIDAYFEGSLPITGTAPESLIPSALAAALIYHIRTVAVRESLRPMVSQIGGKGTSNKLHNYMVRSEKEVFDINLEGSQSGRYWKIKVNGKPHTVETPKFEFYRRRLKLNINGDFQRFRTRINRRFIYMAHCGVCLTFEIYTPKEWAVLKYMPVNVDKEPENVLFCPMPGLVVNVLAKKGDRVFRGQSLAIIESMKMESGVASPCDGVVSQAVVKPGQAVEAGDVLIRFE
ncbi:AccA: propionyl-CoA carboxylase, subunit alpha [Desulfosarcina variabilis str. Montpellier]|uniref:acetyl/propionyl/methylcrotonyl-CoA carboxylase subunit alpha n=1 Tax=Desulfosarcina variabilis TaxID=2300 RepID=UPI003AFA281F